MDVSVAVATYGASKWADLARRRAIPSAARHGVPVVHVHGATLHEARNRALATVTTEWVCHLDADDELEPGYFHAMAEGTADVRAPKVRYVVKGYPNRLWMPQVAGHRHDCTADCLPYGNWIVVGAVARTELLRSVGGWKDWPMFEDWCLWLRCHLAGATIEPIPAAVYRAHVRSDSRNRAPDREAKHTVHQAIARAYSVPVPA